jgi:sporulation protein YlmC with PRC-barrel domain
MPHLLAARAAAVYFGTVDRQVVRPSKWRGATGTAGSVACFLLTICNSGRNHMFAKYITASVAASALFAGVAFAQTPTTQTPAAHTPTTTSDPANTAPAMASDSSFQGDWRTSKVVGLNVYNDNNENVGSINDLLTDKNGNIKAAVISVGGFLGVGSHLVAVPFDKIKFVNEPVAYTGVAGAPNAPGNRPPSTTTTGAAGSNPTAMSSKANPWYPDHATFNATKDELKAMPEFKYSM